MAQEATGMVVESTSGAGSLLLGESDSSSSVAAAGQEFSAPFAVLIEGSSRELLREERAPLESRSTSVLNTWKSVELPSTSELRCCSLSTSPTLDRMRQRLRPSPRLPCFNPNSSAVSCTSARCLEVSSVGRTSSFSPNGRPCPPRSPPSDAVPAFRIFANAWTRARISSSASVCSSAECLFRLPPRCGCFPLFLSVPAFAALEPACWSAGASAC